MKKGLFLCTCFLFVILMSGCSNFNSKIGNNEKVQFTNDKFINMSFKIEKNWESRYERSNREIKYTYKNYSFGLCINDLSNKYEIVDKEETLNALLNAGFPENQRTSVKQENTEIDGIKAVLTTFNAPRAFFDGKTSDNQVNVEDLYFVLDEKLYFITFVNNDSSTSRNESILKKILKSIKMDRSVHIEMFNDDSLKKENFQGLEFMVNWSTKTDEVDKILYYYDSNIGILAKDISNKSEFNDKLFKTMINDYSRQSKIEEINLINEVESKVKIDELLGSERIYKGRISGQEIIIDIVMFETDGKLYSLILTSSGPESAISFQEEREEFYQFIKSIKIATQ